MSAPPAGVVDLCLPADWCDLVLGDDAGARARFADLAQQVWPGGPEHLRTAVADALVAWRARLVAAGAVSHGVVGAVAPGGEPAVWHVISSVVELPRSPEVDLTAVLAELLPVRIHDVLHVERFATDLGLGVGFVAAPEALPPPGPGPAAGGRTVRTGLAGALACVPGAGHGLLVTGACLAAGQVAELAALVATIAGRSRLRPAPTRQDGGPR
ncbi:hypothetical protein [Blastococcus montanus]|uniref:hypothetical protein n=1 Tax=Blastococcus montanus TaxID=3144973 RepID=UPI00320A20AB